MAASAAWYYLLGHWIGFMIGRFAGSAMMKTIAPARLLSFFAAGSLVGARGSHIAAGPSILAWLSESGQPVPRTTADVSSIPGDTGFIIPAGTPVVVTAVEGTTLTVWPAPGALGSLPGLEEWTSPPPDEADGSSP